MPNFRKMAATLILAALTPAAHADFLTDTLNNAAHDPPHKHEPTEVESPFNSSTFSVYPSKIIQPKHL